MPEVVARDTALIGAAKAALEVYVRHLARELGPRGHRVNLLKFGAVVTPAMARTLGGRLSALERALLDAMPARRLCTLQEVARFVAVLTGSDAAWFNGATIDFTGGEAHGLYDALIRATQDRQTESPHDAPAARRSLDPLAGSARPIAG
jgi:NAD(P)-dependent dehydrogenase (short-subunit alcohol dehydrogenase family)